MKKHILRFMDALMILFLVSSLLYFLHETFIDHTRHRHYQAVVHAALPYQHGIEQCFQRTENLQYCHQRYKTVPAAITANDHHNTIHHITVAKGGIITVSPRPHHGILVADILVLRPQMAHGRLHWYASGQAVAKGYTE